MLNKKILIKNEIIEKRGGVAILDLNKYRKMQEIVKEYKKKEKLLRSLAKFESLAKWGRNFARKRKITQKEILRND